MNEKEKQLLESFKLEELEKRFEMGWRLKSVDGEVKTGVGDIKFDTSKLK